MITRARDLLLPSSSVPSIDMLDICTDCSSQSVIPRQGHIAARSLQLTREASLQLEDGSFVLLNLDD